MNDMEKAALGAAAPLVAQFAADLIAGKYGTPKEAARTILGIGLSLVPREELIPYLTEEGKLAAELAADIAERAKFGT